ncbi:hypothetical protein KW791_01360 [Candidatus Parcubacteria bacterium]|nr:hypothetical protein [Candidatus Parcubacteria bacterium]
MAHTGKSQKSLFKRIKISSGGIILKRRPHQNHFNSKESGNATRGKRGDKHAPHELVDKVKALLPSL